MSTGTQRLESSSIYKQSVGTEHSVRLERCRKQSRISQDFLTVAKKVPLSGFNTMTGIRLYVVFWLLSLITIHYGLCCNPAEIGQQYTIISTANVPSGSSVAWELNSGIILYDSLSSHPNGYPSLYAGTRTQLTIRNVTINDGTIVFQHLINDVPVYNCALPVFKRPSTLVCEAVTLFGNQLKTKCTTAQVFPQAKCQFALQNGGTDTINISDGPSYITYTRTYPQPGGNEYYSTSCTLQYPVDGLKPGNWTVQVFMYPDLAGVSLSQGTTGQAASTLTLSMPTVNIDSLNCPKGLAGEGDANVRYGYIRKGERASCLCTRSHAGNPTGVIGWSSTQKGNFNILSQNEDEATVQINSPDTFTCQSISVLGATPHSMTYTPKYAYGPNEVTTSFADSQLREIPNEPFNLCSSEGLDLIVICGVKPSDVLPALTFNDFKLNKPNAITTLETHLNSSGGVYKLVNKLKINPGGSHTLICEARNPVFRDLKKTRSVTIEARRPPSAFPVVSAWSRQNGHVLVYGDDVTIKCIVYGGYPSVESVTLTCGQDDSVTSNGTSTELTLYKIEQNKNSIKCVCQATHVTGCYDSKEVLTLHIFNATPPPPTEMTTPAVTTNDQRLDFGIQCICKLPLYSDGTYPYPDDCHRFIQCNNGQTIVIECPKGLYFNEDKRLCDTLDNVSPKCQQTATQSNLTTPDVDISNICSVNNWTDGSYPNPYYIQCNNGKTSIVACPNNLVYNSARKLCDNP